MARVTNLGDASVTICAAAVLFACFLWSSRRLALHWLVAVGVCGGVTATGKVALYMHGTPIPPIWLGSPSGHVAASVLVYGVLPLAAAGPRRAWVALAAGLVVLIAVSRIYLQAHTASDVLAGACIGGASLAWFLLGRAPWRASVPLARNGVYALRTGAPLTILLGLAGATWGWRLHLDDLLRSVASFIGS